MFIDQKAIDFFSKEMVLVKIDAKQDTVTREKYRVSGYPTTVLIRKSGEESDRLVGYAPTDEFLKTLVDYSQGIGTLDDLLRQVRELNYKIGEKYKYRGGAEEAEDWFARVIETGELLDSLAGEARMAVADLYRRARDHYKALWAFQSIAEDFETGPFAMDAEIYMAIIFRSMGDTTNAISAFENYVEKYPESEDAEWAKKQVEKLKNPSEDEN